MSLDFGLIGKRLSHSFSRSYFTNKFQREGQHYSYRNFELSHVSAVRDLVASNKNLRGFNVTIPYKSDIIPYLDGLDPVAEKIGAVNTVHVKNGVMVGYNTDVIGFRDTLISFYAGDPGGKALVLGTGGASKAVRYVLEHYFQFGEVWMASRSPSHQNHISYSQLCSSSIQDYSLIVNATPVGMFPEQGKIPALPYETLVPTSYLYDLIYNPDETRFLQKGRLYRCPTKNGMEMLIRQAEASWGIWMDQEIL